MEKGSAIEELSAKRQVFRGPRGGRAGRRSAKSVDALERPSLTDDCWPLPKYSEMLFML
ncbi:MAG: hypothetical protein MZU84_02200 [Sphingobacterium sp.]|nr:hypothetical protein [Sphingobacterium sp.]